MQAKGFEANTKTQVAEVKRGKKANSTKRDQEKSMKTGQNKTYWENMPAKEQVSCKQRVSEPSLHPRPLCNDHL